MVLRTNNNSSLYRINSRERRKITFSDRFHQCTGCTKKTKKFEDGNEVDFEF